MTNGERYSDESHVFRTAELPQITAITADKNSRVNKNGGQ